MRTLPLDRLTQLEFCINSWIAYTETGKNQNDRADKVVGEMKNERMRGGRGWWGTNKKTNAFAGTYVLANGNLSIGSCLLSIQFSCTVPNPYPPLPLLLSTAVSRLLYNPGLNWII